MNIPARRAGGIGFGINPAVEAHERHRGIHGLDAAPNLHAEHVFR